MIRLSCVMKGRVTLARTALRSLPFELSAVRLLHLVCHGVELRGEVLDKVSEFLPRLHLLAGTSVPFRSFTALGVMKTEILN